MPPVTTPRGRQKQADDPKRAQLASPPTWSPAPESGDEQGSTSQQKSQRGLKGSIYGSSPAKNMTAAGKDPSSTRTRTPSTATKASEQSIDRYPVTRLVLDLEKRDQAAQDKYNSLKKKHRELDAALNLSTKEREKEKSVFEADYKSFQDALDGAAKELRNERKRADRIRARNDSLEAELAAHASTIEALNADNSKAKANFENLQAAHVAILEELEKQKHKINESTDIQFPAYDALLRQLEKEQNKAKELRATNESLVAVLAAQSQEKDFLAKMLEEKTYESWIFRCAVGVIYKDSPSGERVEMGKLIRDVLFYLRDKRQRERVAQQQAGENDGNGSQEDGDGQDEEQEQEQEQVAEAAPHHHEEPGPEMSDAGASDRVSEDLPLGGRATRPKRHRRMERMDYSDYSLTSDDTDDETPLVDVLKKRAKKLKTTGHYELASSAD